MSIFGFFSFVVELLLIVLVISFWFGKFGHLNDSKVEHVVPKFVVLTGVASWIKLFFSLLIRRSLADSVKLIF